MSSQKPLVVVRICKLDEYRKSTHLETDNGNLSSFGEEEAVGIGR